MAAVYHGNHVPLYRRGPPPGFGEHRRRQPPLKKHVFPVSDVPFELDVKYAPIQFLGNGSFGVVCSCLNQHTKEMVAVKKIPLSNPTTALQTLREMQILRQIRHENVISIKDVMLSSSLSGKADFKDVYLVSELMDTDLFSVMDFEKLSGEECKYVLFQILKGLSHLHSANVIHRDLKPENLLVKSGVVKICDFGYARTKYDDDQFMTAGGMTTRWYRAPEILLNSNCYGKEVDMWSVGCIFAEMLGGKGPFLQGSDPLSQIRMIHAVVGTQPVSELGFIASERAKKYLIELPFSSGKDLQGLFPEADQLAIDLLSRMLVLNPDRRVSAMEALKHPYFSDINDPMTVSSSMTVESVRLCVDENPKAVDEKMARELIWEEMLLHLPEERS